MKNESAKCALGYNKEKSVPNRKTIVIYSQSDLSRDPRVHRQIELLAKHYRIIAFGKKPPTIKVDRFLDIAQMIGIPERKTISANFFLEYIKRFGIVAFFAVSGMKVLDRIPACQAFLSFWMTKVVCRKVLSRLKAIQCDLIVANDLSALPVCAEAKGNRKLLYDAHEYSPGQFPRERKYLAKRSFARYALQRYLPYCDIVTAVGNGIARLYRLRFGIDCTVITNAPSYSDLRPQQTEKGKIRLVHHGLAARRRNLELMIDVMGLLDDRFTLDFYLVFFDPVYYQQLKGYAAKDPKITFHDPVSMQRLPYTLNAYDIGFWLFEPITLNLSHALPNKFFEFVQARLMVAIGPSPEMAAYVERYGLGVVAKDFTPESMAAALSDLTQERIMEYKMNAHKCAWELSSEPNNEKILALVRGLIGE